MDAITEIYLPPQKRPTGTFNFEHNFEEGNYVGLLKLRDESGEHITRFPFAVGQVSMQHTMHLGLMFLMLLVGGGAAIWVSRTRRDKDFLRRGGMNPRQKSKKAEKTQKTEGV